MHSLHQMAVSLSAMALMAALACPAATRADGKYAFREHRLPYQLSMEASCAALPVASGDFISQHQSLVEIALFHPANSSGKADGGAQLPHYVLLDFAATDVDQAARRVVAANFPRAKALAHKLSGQIGSLPWAIDSQYANLVAALREGRWTDAAQNIGMIIHYATDAALPFNTTTLAAEELGVNITGSDSEKLAPRRLRERFHGSIVSHLSDRFAYEVRVSPTRTTVLPSPIDATFAVLLESHRAAMELSALDEEVIRELGVDDVAGFAAAADIYSVRLAERAAPILENQIESGALLAASLIHTAWTTARPDYPEVATDKNVGSHGDEMSNNPGPDSSDSLEGPPVESNEEKESAPQAIELVGSVNSTVVHRGDCGHAARINPDNLVTFTSIKEAETAGRKACRTCRPDKE